ncbi:TPA: hypothetical protein DCW38_06560 [candidate division WOR-3 bacterium]|uniref:Guanylate cyclase domain-containing protein n=1 Tax=candidate division WOR-3 bacterium TaxID=2052148 RepID=A0A350HBA9_UNCW3|nr:hypothetical protein [candidate division WOR-3 bacterium]
MPKNADFSVNHTAALYFFTSLVYILTMAKSKPIFYPRILSFMLESNKTSMRLPYYILFADISGFTQISENLMSEGFEGAERIRDILNRHFEFFSRTIRSKSGDILQYSGDAILSVFPSFDKARESMEEIIEFTKTSGVLSIRGGISFGDVDFRIFDFNGGYILLSQGSAIERAMKAEQMSDIMKYVSLTEESSILPEIKNVDLSSIPIDKSISEMFESCNLDFGSFAFACILFLFAEECDIPYILKLAENRIFINKIERYPEGIRLFLLSGVLNSKQNPVESMLEFIHDLTHSGRMEKLAGGFTSGYIFNGFTGSQERCEYNLIGKSINRAARIASKAKTGEILFDKEILEESSSASGEFIRSENLKGIGMISLYRMKEYRRHTVPLYLPLFGRELEMERISEILKDSPAVKISGESGSGKTHLVSSYIYEKNLNAIYLNVSNTDSLFENSILKMLGLEISEEDASNDSAYKKFLNYMLAADKNEILIIDNFEKLDSKSTEIVKRFISESSCFKTILISSESEDSEIHLQLFDSKGISGIIETRTGTPPSGILSETLFKKTNGNPYFVLAFFKTLISENLIEMNYLGEWEMNSEKAGVSKDISSSVQMIFSSLSAIERNILKVCSVFDFGCSEELLLKMLHNYKIEIVSKVIMELIQKNLLLKRERTISFVNDVVREHIYKSILLKERISLHRTAAKGLSLNKDFLEAGRHLYLCGEKENAKNLLVNYKTIMEEGKTTLSLYYALILFELEKSQELFMDIIDLLLKDGRYQEAETLYEKEKATLDADTDIFTRMRLLVFKGEKNKLIDFAKNAANKAKNINVIFFLLDETAFAMAISGDKSASEYALKALDMMNKEQSLDLRRIKLGGTFRELGDYDNVEKIFRMKHKRALDANNAIEAYSALSDMIEMMPPGRFTVDYTLEVNNELLNLLRESDRKQDELKALKVLTMRLRDRGEYEKAFETGMKGIELAKRLKSATTEIIILSQLGRMEFNRGRIDKAIELFLQGAKLAEKNSSLLLLESIYGNMGVCKHVLKEYNEAYNLYEKALEISLKVKHSDTRFLWILNLALLGVESKQLENIDHYLDMAREEILKSGIEERWIDIEQIAVNCAFLQGNYEKCLEKGGAVLEEAKKRSEIEIYYETLPYYAGALLMKGDKQGIQLLVESEEWANKKNSDNVKNNIEDVRRVLNSPDKNF